MPHSFSLSLTAVDMLLERGNLGRAPFPFTLPHIGTTHTHRAQVRDAVLGDLASRGLLRTGRLDADVGRALETFVSSPVSISAAAQLDGGRQLFARVSSTGQYAVVARQDENMLLFAETGPGVIAASIVDLIPLTAAAPGQSITVAKAASPSRSRHSLDDDYDPLAQSSDSTEQASSQLRAAERLFAQPKLRVGQFTAFVHGRHGRETDLSPLAWFDTEAGRYLMSSREASDGQSWLTYAPADNARLAQRLRQQLEEFG